MTVTLNSLEDFNLETLRRVAWQNEPVRFGEEALARIKTARSNFLEFLRKEPHHHIYGVTTGFGDNAGKILPPDEQARMAKVPAFLQGVGVGPLLPERLVRAMILGRLINYVSGYAAVSLETAQAVADMLDGRALPKVPYFGQDSAGELHQFFNLYHQFMGEMSQVRDQNALRNGSGCAPGLLGDIALRARRRARLMTRVFALSLDAGNMGFMPFDPAHKPLFKDPYEGEAIDSLNEALDGATTEGRRPYQSPISFRILARVLGHLFHAVDRVEFGAKTALTAVNDNPIYFGPEESPPNGRCVGTGNFHVPSSYQLVNWLTAAQGDLATLAAFEMRQLHKADVTGLTERLALPGQRASTLFVSVAAHDIARRAQDCAQPTMIPLYVGNDGQTDTIFPLFQALEKDLSQSRHMSLLMAMLAACASQAFAVSKRPPAPKLRPLLEDVRKYFLPVEGPRNMGVDLDRLAERFEAYQLGQTQEFGLS